MVVGQQQQANENSHLYFWVRSAVRSLLFKDQMWRLSPVIILSIHLRHSCKLLQSPFLPVHCHYRYFFALSNAPNPMPFMPVNLKSKHQIPAYIRTCVNYKCPIPTTPTLQTVNAALTGVLLQILIGPVIARQVCQIIYEKQIGQVPRMLNSAYNGLWRCFWKSECILAERWIKVHWRNE